MPKAMSETGKGARPMKEGLGESAVKRLGSALAEAWPQFDARGFGRAGRAGLDDLELKERVNHLIAVMDAFLPGEFEEALEIVERAGSRFPAGDPRDNLAGFAAWPLIDWIPTRGLDHLDLSLKALRKLTPLFSAEFAVRPFLLKDPQRALKQLESWTVDENEHVRRLVSEGTRPRLPWGCRLPMFMADPQPVLGLLEKLKDDPSEYVRRSVANNLNDIAKDHPERVVQTCRAWSRGASEQRKGLIRHGLRTLVKQGDRGALALLGFTTNPKVKVTMGLSKDSLPIGAEIQIEVELVSRAKRRQKLVVDYVVHHVRRNGKTTPKVFKLRNLDLAPGESVAFGKKHSFLPRSVRRYYPGRHRVELLVGGRVMADCSFTMTD
jgi:3-methyladenine DNA glycosylase AlkC